MEKDDENTSTKKPFTKKINTSWFRPIAITVIIGFSLFLLTLNSIVKFFDSVVRYFENKGSLQYLALLILVLFLVIVFRNILSTAKKQLNTKQATLFFYVTLTFFVYTVSNLVYFAIPTKITYIITAKFGNWFGFARIAHLQYTTYWIPFAVVVGLFVLFYFLAKSKCLVHDSHVVNFYSAPGAVGLNNDKFDFKDSAKVFSERIYAGSDSQGPVSVITLDGGQGFGKSSYLRMTIEQMQKDHKDSFLYTYISLTEANEELDFSRLFSERWTETLSEKYLVDNFTSIFSLLESISKDLEPKGFFSFLKYLKFIALPKLPTKRYMVEKSGNTDELITIDTRAAKIFGHIREIQEKVFIVVIDEADRATFKEVYRMIEVVERFKYYAENYGFPVRVVFVLPCDYDVLQESIVKYEKNDHLVKLIREFFDSGSKSVDYREFLPPVDIQKRIKYILDLLKKFVEGSYRDEIPDISEINLYIKPGDNLKPKEKVAVVIAMLLYRSPRVIGKIFEQVSLKVRTFNDLVGGRSINEVAMLGEIIAVESVAVLFQEEMLNIINTASLFTDEARIENLQNSIALLYYNNDKSKEKGSTKKLKANEYCQNFFKIIHKGILNTKVMDYDIPFTSGDDYTKADILFHRSLQKQKNLYDYMRSYSDKNPTDVGFRFLQIKENEAKIEELKSTELSDFLQYIRSNNSSTNNEVGKKIFTEFIEKVSNNTENLIQPSGVGRETYYTNFVYEILFSAAYLTNREVDILDYILTFLKSNKVPLSSRFIFIYEIFNSANEAGNINSELERLYSLLFSHNNLVVIELVRELFQEFDSSYLDNKSTINIFEEEENFFFLAFQAWDGEQESISKISERLKNDLINLKNTEIQARALRAFWQNYPYFPGMDSDILEKDRIFLLRAQSIQRFLSTDQLIGITEKVLAKSKGLFASDDEFLLKFGWWKKHVGDPRVNGEVNKIYTPEELGEIEKTGNKRDLPFRYVFSERYNKI